MTCPTATRRTTLTTRTTRTGDHAPITRSERREARDAGEGDAGAGWAAPAAASSAPAAGAVGGAAAGASAWAARGDQGRHGDEDRPGDGDHHGDEESERIASAADFRDDVPAEPTEVYAAQERGSEPDMSDNSSTETTQHPGNDDGLDAGGAAAAASAGGGAYAATRAMHDDGGNGSGVRTETTDDTETTGDTATATIGRPPTAHRDRTDAHDVDTERGDSVTRGEGDPAEMTIIAEPDAYATTEPVLASEQTAPVSPEQADAGAPPRSDDADASREAGSTDERGDDAASGDEAPAEVGAAVAETDGTDRSAADVAEESTQERYDPTPTRDWAADEGDLLEENSDRGDRLEAERADLAHEAGDATPTTASDDAGATASGDDAASDVESAPRHPTRSRAPRHPRAAGSRRSRRSATVASGWARQRRSTGGRSRSTTRCRGTTT